MTLTRRISILGFALALGAATAPARGQEAAPDPRDGPSSAVSPAPEPQAAPPSAVESAPLTPAERDTLLGLAWRTLIGHLTASPIQNQDLEAYSITPSLSRPSGCFVVLKVGGQMRGMQGEIETTRPLYQQVILFTRRAATRDPRFLPLTALDLDRTMIEIAVIGRRERVVGPASIAVDRQGVFLEKWGRRALFLPGVAAAQGWSAERTLEELCRQASLPAKGWTEGARIETFEVESITGPRPEPPARPTESPAGPAELPPEVDPKPAPGPPSGSAGG